MGKNVFGAQLAILKKGSANNAEYRQQCLKDLKDLRELIVDILLIPFQDVEKTDAALSSHFKDQILPSSLVWFIKNLVVDDVCNKWDVIWILGYEFFWTSAEKYSLIRKLHSRGYRLKHFRDLANLNYRMELTLAIGQREHWSSLLPPEGPIRDVYKYKAKEYEGHDGFGQTVFLGIVFIFKNVVGHYNDCVGFA